MIEECEFTPRETMITPKRFKRKNGTKKRTNSRLKIPINITDQEYLRFFGFVHYIEWNILYVRCRFFKVKVQNDIGVRNNAKN